MKIHCFFLAYAYKFNNKNNKFFDYLCQYVDNGIYKSNIFFINAILVLVNEKKMISAELINKLSEFFHMNFVYNFINNIVQEHFNNKEYQVILDLDESLTPRVVYFKGRINKELRNYSKAIEQLNDYISNEVGLKKEDKGIISSAFFHLGELYYQINNLEKAEINFLKASNIYNGNHKEANNYLNKIKIARR